MEELSEEEMKGTEGGACLVRMGFGIEKVSCNKDRLTLKLGTNVNIAGTLIIDVRGGNNNYLRVTNINLRNGIWDVKDPSNNLVLKCSFDGHILTIRRYWVYYSWFSEVTRTKANRIIMRIKYNDGSTKQETFDWNGT